MSAGPRRGGSGGAWQPLIPGFRSNPHRVRLTAANAMALIAGYDIVADGSDNFATRFLLNDACFFAKKPLVSAAVTEFEGQLATYKGYEPGCPCYRCLFPAPPPPGTVANCSETGVLGAAAGVMGSLAGPGGAEGNRRPGYRAGRKNPDL